MWHKTILIFGLIKFPNKDAGSNRVMGLAEALKKAGYKVVVIGTGNLDQNKNIDEIEGIIYSTIYAKRMPKFIRGVFLLSGGLAFYLKARQIGIKRASIYISYGNYFFGNFIIYFIARYIYKAKFIVDAVEWQEPFQFKYNIFDLNYINAELGVRFFYPLIKNVIVISRYLFNYFNEKKCNILYLPPILDTHQVPFKIRSLNHEKIALVYFGQPGKKDDFNTIIEAMRKLDTSEIIKFEIHIYGLTYFEFLDHIYEIKEKNRQLLKIIQCHGRTEKSILLTDLLSYNFMILLRKESRFSRAGFPSRLPEALASGLPVIMNEISDIKYFINQDVSFIIPRLFAEDLANVFKYILYMDKRKYINMSIKAREVAAELFDYRKWVLRIDNYIKTL